MHIAAHFRRVCFPLILISLAVIAAPCFAVSMHITVGFDGVAKTAFWTPVAVRLVNSGEENVQGALVITQPDNTTPIPTCTTQVDLPAHSTKLYHVYVRLTDYGGKLKVSLARGYGVLASREVNVQPADGGDMLIVTIGERAARLSFLEGELINAPSRPNPHAPPGAPGRSGSYQATIHAGSISPAELPDRPAGLEDADVIIANGLSPDTTNPNALKALCMWVASGGTLVVSTGADYKAYTNAFYNELLPVDIVGAASVPGMPSLSSIGGKAFPAGAAAVTKSTIKPGIGAVTLSESGVPLMAERSYGAGRVIFLAFDHRSSPFKDWNGQIAFWKSIIRGSPGDSIVETNTGFSGDAGRDPYQEQDYSGFSAVVTQNPSIKTPSVNTIGMFLLAYLVVLVPVNYAVLRKRRRLELAWVTTPAIVLVFALGAYVIGYTMKGGELRLSECSLVEGSSGARYARAVTNAFVFSPARRSYNLTVSDPTALSQVVAMSREDSPADTYLGETTSIQGVGIPMWSSKTLEAVGGVDLGGSIETNLRMSNGEISGTIKNNTGVDLRDCEVYYGNARSDSVTLGKGQTQEIHVMLGKGGPAPPPQDYYDPETSVKLRLLRFGDSSAASQGSLTLVGFRSPEKGVFDLPEDSPRTERAACYIFHLNYDMGNAVSISPAMVAASRTSGSAEATPANGMLVSNYMYGRSGFMGRYRLPLPPGFKVTSLRVVGSAGLTGPAPPPGAATTAPAAKTPTVSCSIRNCLSGKWDPVSLPSGKSVANAANYVGPNNQVMIRVANRSGSTLRVNCGISAEARRQ